MYNFVQKANATFFFSYLQDPDSGHTRVNFGVCWWWGCLHSADLWYMYRRRNTSSAPKETVLRGSRVRRTVPCSDLPADVVVCEVVDMCLIYYIIHVYIFFLLIYLLSLSFCVCLLAFFLHVILFLFLLLCCYVLNVCENISNSISKKPKETEDSRMKGG